MSDYVITRAGSGDELMHYGVLGMKWGVRRYRNPDGSLTPAGKKRQDREENRRKKREARKEYKSDKAVRIDLTEKANASSEWHKEYERLYKRESERVGKKFEKELLKNGEISPRTKERINTINAMKYDKAYMKAQKDYDIAKLEKHVNNMMSKYGNKKVKDVKEQIKNGEKYCTDWYTGHTYSYELIPRKTTDRNGKTITRYVPTRVVYSTTVIPV